MKTIIQGISATYFVHQKTERFTAVTQIFNRLYEIGKNLSYSLGRVYEKSVFHDFENVFRAPVQ